MKVNIQNSYIARAGAFALAVVFLFCYLAIPSFAAPDNNVDFDFLPVSSATSATNIVSSGLLLFLYSSDWHWYAVANSDSAPVYPLVVGSSLYFAFDSNLGLESSQYPVVKFCSDVSTNVTTFSTYNNINTEYDIRYSSPSSVSVSSSNCFIPFFSGNDLNSALSELRDYLDSLNGGASAPHQFSTALPAGNAIYIDVSGIDPLNVQLSISTEVAHPQSWYSNQYYGFASSYPSSFSGNPSGSTTIPWNGYGQTTIFNRYRSFSWSLDAYGSHGDYLFIVNPYASLDEYDQSFNPTIYITVNNARGYKFYQMTGGIGPEGQIGQQTDGTTASGTFDDSTGSWSTTNDQTGQPWTPSEGGGNLITTNSINDWLKTIATQISNFFQGAIGAVTTLVSAGSAFINSLLSLYSWLPAPVLSVLSSALILVITIGVIKVFI